MEHINKMKALCFGEILWDVLPAATLPGGAPMNVAYHLKKLGSEAALISRAGNDEPGKKLQALLIKSDINIDALQMDEQLPTGIVKATIGSNHEVSYDIVKPVAWDAIEWNNNMAQTSSGADCFIFGSLAARSETSRNTLANLISHARYKVFDVNLRAPHYNKTIIEALLATVDLLKLNEDELNIVCAWFGDAKSDYDKIEFLQQKFKIPNIVVTKGSAGAVFNSNGQLHHQQAFPVNVVDTVGSGDCFLAALVTKLFLKEKPGKALEFACAAGSLIAGYNGACPVYDVQEIEAIIQKAAQ